MSASTFLTAVQVAYLHILDHIQVYLTTNQVFLTAKQIHCAIHSNIKINQLCASEYEIKTAELKIKILNPLEQHSEINI